MLKLKDNIQKNLPLYISIFALLVSFMSMNNSREANKIAKEAQRDELTVILNARFSSDSTRFVLSPLTKNIALTSISAYYPPQIDSTVWLIYPTDWELPIISLKWKIENLVKTLYPIREDSMIAVIDGNSIPIILNIQYVTGNKTIQTQTLYSINYRAYFFDSNPTIDILGMVPIGHFQSEYDPKKYLSNLWKKILDDRIK